MTRAQSIMFAYEDCARAIYQSWGVIGLGLFSFALSSFMPTQRFGVLMLLMLTFSTIGNLVLLPAMLASPAGNLLKLPAGIDPRAAAMLDPAAIALHGLWKTDLRAGHRVLVIGAGPIGLSVIEFAKLSGARIIVMDISEIDSH